MDRESRETWAKRVERWKDSGLTAKEYATELGINVRSLVWWRWRLSSAAQIPKPQARRRRATREPTPTGATSLTFVEMPAAVVAEPLEVVLPSSVRIRVPAAFDPSALGRLLDVLDARR